MKLRALIIGGFDFDPAAQVLDCRPHLGETKSGAFANNFRGEKWFKDPVEDVGGIPGPLSATLSCCPRRAIRMLRQ